MDFSARRWRHLDVARKAFNQLEPSVQLKYRYFVNGIRSYMREHPSSVPTWAPPLEPALAVGVYRVILWTDDHVGDGLEACRNAGISLDDEITAELRAAEAVSVSGSNVWVLMPWRTADDALIHLTDPHSGIGHGAFEFGMTAGDLSYSGVCFAGAPLPILAHTRNLAWGLTTGQPRVSDCYEIELEPEDPFSFKLDGEIRRLHVGEQTIEVSGQDPEVRTFEYAQLNGVLSPIVARQDGRAYALCTSYMHEWGLDQLLYDWLRARDVHEFRDAMRPLGMFAQNVMAGDKFGHAWYIRAGRVPIRAAGVDSTRPVSGNTSSAAWRGFHRLEDLVQVLDPTAGYMHNNNVAPDMMFAGAEWSTLDSTHYPDYVFNDLPGRTHDRGRRADALLASAFQATVEDAIAIALDDEWVGTDLWQRALVRATLEDPSRLALATNELRGFVHHLLSFDGVARSDSVGALYYWYWRAAIPRLEGVSPEEAEALWRSIRSGKGLNAGQYDILIRGIQQAVTDIRQEHGHLELTFGDVFRIGRGDSSWPGRGGTFLAHWREPRERLPSMAAIVSLADRVVSPLRSMTYSGPDDRYQRWITSGGGMLRLTVFTEPLRSFTVLLPGQSGNPASPHYSDQVQLYSQQTVKETYLRKEDVLAHAVSTTTITAALDDDAYETADES